MGMELHPVIGVQAPRAACIGPLGASLAHRFTAFIVFREMGEPAGNVLSESMTTLLRSHQRPDCDSNHADKAQDI